MARRLTLSDLNRIADAKAAQSVPVGFEARLEVEPQGYVATTARAKHCDPRYAKYHRWKERVRLIANTKKIPARLNDDEHWQIEVEAFWPGRARIDSTNLLKAAEDALWQNDRRSLCVSSEAHEHCANAFPFMTIAVRRLA